VVNDAYEKMANAMLQFEEEAHLMEYEIGIDMYQRVHSYHYEEEPSDANTAGCRLKAKRCIPSRVSSGTMNWTIMK
jgi:hypothetical protein